MSEKYKFFDADGIFSTTTTIVGWIDIFTRKDYCEIIVDALKYCQREKGLIIHAWCLMPGHLHMMVSRKGQPELQEILRDFKKFTSEQMIKCINGINESRKEWLLKSFAQAASPLKRIRQYKVWQDGNHPIQLSSMEMIEQRLDYIHNNPVAAGLVWEPQHYCWSSAIDYWGERGLLKVELIHLGLRSVK